MPSMADLLDAVWPIPLMIMIMRILIWLLMRTDVLLIPPYLVRIVFKNVSSSIAHKNNYFILGLGDSRISGF